MRFDKDFSKNEPFDDIDRLFEQSDSKIPAPGDAFNLTLANLRAQYELEPAVVAPEPKPVPLRPTLVTLRGVVAAFASAGLVAMLSIAILLAVNFSSSVNQDAPPTIESFAAPASNESVATTAAPSQVKISTDSTNRLSQYLDYTELIRRQSSDEKVGKRPIVSSNNSVSNGFMPQIDRTGDNTVRFEYPGRSFK